MAGRALLLKGMRGADVIAHDFYQPITQLTIMWDNVFCNLIRKMVPYVFISNVAKNLDPMT